MRERGWSRFPTTMSDAEHARLLAEALDPEDGARVELDGELSDQLTARDLAEIWGTTEQTINRWARDGFPNSLGAPWDNAAWIVDGPRRKRLPIQLTRPDAPDRGAEGTADRRPKTPRATRRRWPVEVTPGMP